MFEQDVPELLEQDPRIQIRIPGKIVFLLHFKRNRICKIPCKLSRLSH